MKFDWKQIAKLGAIVIAGKTGHAEIIEAESAVETAVDASKAHKSVDEQVDAYAALATSVIETAEGFEGKELVDDVQVQKLIGAVHDALHALALGLAAKRTGAALGGDAVKSAADLGYPHGSTGD